MSPPGWSRATAGLAWWWTVRVDGRSGRRPGDELVVLRYPLKLRSTRMTRTAETPRPVLHGYTDERGVWEDATFWSPTWARTPGT